VDAETWTRAQAGPTTGRAGSAGFGGQDFGDGWTYVSGGDGADFDGIDLEDLLGGMFAGQGAGRARGGRGWSTGPVPGADQEADLEISLAEACAGGRRSFTITAGASTRTVDVAIPTGVVDGQRIRLAGQGGPGHDGAAHGDLYLRVHVVAEKPYRLDGRDVS
jgi:curved DNA-binding protein